MSAASPSAEHAAECAAFRAALRKEKIAARIAMAGSAHLEASARVTIHLRGLLATHAPGVLAFCAPIRAEYDARPLVTELLARGWQAAMPVVVAKDDAMRYRRWNPASPMAEDAYGVPVPAGGDDCTPDVVLLPVVAFDAAGFRLGYGGGYFDRTLAAQVPRPLAIGVGFELARVTDIRPQPHDLRLDAVVTEMGAFSL